jgi:hypothetical protein
VIIRLLNQIIVICSPFWELQLTSPGCSRAAFLLSASSRRVTPSTHRLPAGDRSRRAGLGPRVRDRGMLDTRILTVASPAYLQRTTDRSTQALGNPQMHPVSRPAKRQAIRLGVPSGAQSGAGRNLGRAHRYRCRHHAGSVPCWRGRRAGSGTGLRGVGLAWLAGKTAQPDRRGKEVGASGVTSSSDRSVPLQELA